MSGLKINPGLVLMQHRSNMISQMLGGRKSLPSIMGAGSANMQARIITRQFDTFERMSEHGYDFTHESAADRVSSDDLDLSTAGGTALEQARAMMRNYDTFTKSSPSQECGAEEPAVMDNVRDAADSMDGGEQPLKETSDGTPKSSDKTSSATYNTDDVDREVKKLKEEIQQLKKQIQREKNPTIAKNLGKRLAQLEKELQQKSSDTYRRQHAKLS